MIIVKSVKMPKNCHECDSYGISDLVGLCCSHEFDLRYDDENLIEHRPDDCPLEGDDT